MNVLTAIFVESGSQIAAIDQDLAIQAQLRRDKSMINTIKSVFYDADKDASGLMTLSELEELLKEPKYIYAMRLIGLDVSEARGLFALLDVNETNAVSIEEFISGMMRLKGAAKSVDLALLVHENKIVYASMQRSLEGMKERIASLESKSAHPSSSRKNMTKAPRWNSARIGGPPRSV
eukprot:4764376-Amphidinium_carterae.1